MLSHHSQGSKVQTLALNTGQPAHTRTLHTSTANIPVSYLCQQAVPLVLTSFKCKLFETMPIVHLIQQ